MDLWLPWFQLFSAILLFYIFYVMVFICFPPPPSTPTHLFFLYFSPLSAVYPSGGAVGVSWFCVWLLCTGQAFIIGPATKYQQQPSPWDDGQHTWTLSHASGCSTTPNLETGQTQASNLSSLVIPNLMFNFVFITCTQIKNSDSAVRIITPNNQERSFMSLLSTSYLVSLKPRVLSSCSSIYFCVSKQHTQRVIISYCS